MKLLATQPTFLPWLGYFDLINDADVVVFLDDVQLERRSWQVRNNIRTAKGLEYISIPVYSKGKRNQLIKDTLINIPEIHLNKIKNKIIHNYSKSKNFEIFFHEFFNIFSKGIKKKKLIDLNCDIIYWICKILKINKKFYFSSKLKLNSKSTLRILEICNNFGAKNYITTSGSENYLAKDKELIKKFDISIYIHNYKHPKYNQNYKPFINFASTIDLIFNEGHNAKKIISSGRSKYKKLII